MSPFAHEVIIYLMKMALAGIGFLTAAAVALQMYFRKAITHEAKKAVVKKKLVDDGSKANAALLSRFERDIERMKDELAATRTALAHATRSEAELMREYRYLTGELQEMRQEMARLQPTQTDFLGKMDKFIASLQSMKLAEKPLKGSGGKVKISGDPVEG